MFFQQFYLQSLGHASYLVGDEKTDQALVFDPRRDVEVYLDAAREQGMRIAYAADSHGHNDYLSGLSALRTRTGAQLWGSGAGELGYAHRPLVDGETVEIGDVGIEVLHTPGHTPEHVSLLVYDRAHSADVPVLLLSGGASPPWSTAGCRCCRRTCPRPPGSCCASATPHHGAGYAAA